MIGWISVLYLIITIPEPPVPAELTLHPNAPPPLPVCGVPLCNVVADIPPPTPPTPEPPVPPALSPPPAPPPA